MHGRRKNERDNIYVNVILKISRIAEELNNKSEVLRNSMENISATIEEMQLYKKKLKRNPWV